MKMQLTDNGLTVWLSANDTHKWAQATHWPCSTLAGRRCVAVFDSNGLCEFTVNGRDNVDCAEHELAAIIADHVKGRIPKDHPLYYITEEHNAD